MFPANVDHIQEMVRVPIQANLDDSSRCDDLRFDLSLLQLP